MTKFEAVGHESLPSSSKSPSQGQEQEEEEEEEDLKGRIVLSKEPGSEEARSSRENHSEDKVVEDKLEEENDGFRTPTSLDHRIPVLTNKQQQCPNAPRKPKPSLKRKASSSSSPHSSSCSWRHPLDLSREVELLFPNKQRNRPLSDSHRSAKKFRRETSPRDV